MDDFEKIMEGAKEEGLDMSQKLLGLVLHMWDRAREDVQAATAAARRLRPVSVIAAVISVVCLCTCIYQGTVIQRQGGEISALRGEVESIHKILDSGVVIEETTTTTETTTIEQDTGEGSGNNVFQSGEYSSYTQNGGV